LDGSVGLKYSEPQELAMDMNQLRIENKLKIFEGCCGTDQRHREEIAKRLSQL